MTSRVIQALVKKDTFIGEKALYEIERAFLVRKNMDKRMFAFLNRFVQNLLQLGFFWKFFHNIPNWTVFDLAKEGGRDGLMTYLNLNDFMKENTVVAPLRFDKLDYFFRAYLALQGLLLISSLIHSVLNISIRRVKVLGGWSGN